MTSAPRCPACASTATQCFYECRDIPVQSCVLLEEREAALAYPRGDLSLYVCADCAFIFNARFSYEVQGEIEEYEASQAHSPRFSAYLSDLCATLSSRHELRGGRIVEIGCGAGDFLRELCERSGARGVGYDPALPDASVEEAEAATVQLRKRAFDPTADAGDCALVACRHTLEHIARPGGMLAQSRALSAASGNCPIVYEVPDTLRILEDAAFWDVYYEHCSYFTAGSLARLFQREGLAITHLERVYDDQYLVVEAVPKGAGARGAFPGSELVDDRDRVLAGTESFRKQVGATLETWRERLTRAAETGERVALWGAGSKAAGFLATLGIRDQIPLIVDVNPRKQGMFQAGSGQEIVAPERLKDYRPDLLVIMNAIYRDEIGADLERMGLAPEIRAL